MVVSVSPTNGGLTVSGYSLGGTANLISNYIVSCAKFRQFPYQFEQFSFSFHVVAPTYTHTIFYNANGGGGYTEFSRVTDTNSGNTNVTFASNGFTAPAGHYFAGWRIDNTGTVYQPGNTYAVGANGSVIAYAYWLPSIAKTNVNVNGSWVKGSVYVNVNGTWTESKKIYVKVNGVWEESSG